MFFQQPLLGIRRAIRVTSRLALLTWFMGAGSAYGDVGPSELWKINADGTGLARFVETPGETCGSPEWSPDGKYVAYGSWRVDQSLRDAHIIVIRADGKDRRDLGPGAMASWSPDGKQLVFHTYSNGTDPNYIVVMNADGTSRKNILDHWGSPRWSRRGDRIVSILDDNFALYDVITGDERTILPKPYPMYWGFGLSPDGNRICFGGAASGLYLATLDEKSMQATVRTLVDSGKSTYASFAPDGKRVVFSCVARGARLIQLYTMDVDKNAKPKHLDGQDKTRVNWSPNWSPDGKTIIFGSKTTD